ncbi:MAG: alpha-hydroxy acid oxidase [Geminicoccaceae bacterium]
MAHQDAIGTKTSKRIFCTDDAQKLARSRLPRLVLDYIEGAAGREVAVKRNQSRFDDIMLQPRVMNKAQNRSAVTHFLSRDYGLPFGIAPMGMCNLSWPGADRFLAEAARDFNIPICLSSAASSSIEEMRGWAGDKAWFQLYVGPSMAHSLELVERASEVGYETLVLTVDVPKVARRVRDLKNGFQMPFSIGPRQFIDFVRHPRWSLATLMQGAPKPKNFAGDGNRFDRHGSREGADWDFLDRLRGLWKGRLIIKGVTSVPDALRIQASGVDAIYVSNHGGRQFDSVPSSIDLLPRIRAAVGPDYPLILDSGVRSGEDVVKALTLGADFVMLGRPLLYALAAEADRGLYSLIRVFAEEIDLAMTQLGIGSIADLDANSLFVPAEVSVPDTAEDAAPFAIQQVKSSRRQRRT